MSITTIRKIARKVLTEPDISRKIDLSIKGHLMIKENNLNLGEREESEWVFPSNLEFINPYTKRSTQSTK